MNNTGHSHLQRLARKSFCRLFADFLPTLKGQQRCQPGPGTRGRRKERNAACQRHIAQQIHIRIHLNYQIQMKTVGARAMCSKVLPDLGKYFCRLFAGFLPTFCRPSSTNTKGNQLNASGVGCMERIPVCRLRIVPQIHIACYANYQILMKTIGTSSM